MSRDGNLPPGVEYADIPGNVDDWTDAAYHLCKEAPMIRIVFSIAQCVRCRWLIDFTTDEVLASTAEEIRSTRIGLSMLPSTQLVGARLDRIRPEPLPADVVRTLR